jgi:hypothetical protein
MRAPLVCVSLPWVSIALGCGDTAPPSDAGSADARVEPDAAPDAGGATRFGLVQPFSISYDFPEETRHHHSLTVSFDRPTGCTVTRLDGECTVQTCTDPPAVESHPHAGEVRVTGGAVDPLVVEPDADGSYPFLRDDTTSLFAGGETLRVTGAGGGGVPAFDAEVIAPENVTVVMPRLVERESPFEIDRGEPLAIAWSGTTSGRVHVMVYTPGDAGLEASADCTFASGATGGTVPSAALLSLPAGTATIVAFIESEEVLVNDGEWQIRLLAFGYALGPSGAARQNITLR